MSNCRLPHLLVKKLLTFRQINQISGFSENYTQLETFFI